MRKPLFIALLLFGSAHAGAEITPDRKAELIHMLRHDCGSCHGMTMKGGLGPALVPQALQGKEPETLTATVLHGRGGTAMPPWQGILTEEEAQWLVSILRKGVPND